MNIFITGISSGIGKALAQNYLEQGHIVDGISRRALDFKHENLTHTKVDMTDSKSIESLGLKDHYDLVILSAGILGAIKKLQDSNLGELKRVMDINLWGQKLMIDKFLNKSKVNNIVAISSGAAVKGSLGWSGYSLSKAALNMLIQLYAAEQVDTKFIALAPGLVDTKMQEYIRSIDADYYPNLKRLQEAHGTESMPEPDRFAQIFNDSLDWILTHESGSFIDLRSKPE
jgi:NAD(P)-dependent dehydrogenase (short-subunit alcohol dehydrogenase family)